MISILHQTPNHVEAAGNIKDLKVFNLLNEAKEWLWGEWDSDEKVSNTFSQIDINNREDDSRRIMEKKQMSMRLMRFLGPAFNVDFVIMECFTEHDLNSIKKSQDNFHYFTIKEKGNENKIVNLDNSFFKDGGLYWPDKPTLLSKVIRQDLTSVDNTKMSQVKACPLPVFIIWDNDKWNFVHWKELYNTAIAEEMNLAKYKQRMGLIDRVNQGKERSFGGDWRGGIPTPTPLTPDSNNAGLGHFGGYECGEGDEDDDDGEGGRGKRNPKFDGQDDRSDSDSDDDDGWYDDGDSGFNDSSGRQNRNKTRRILVRKDPCAVVKQ